VVRYVNRGDGPEIEIQLEREHQTVYVRDGQVRSPHSRWIRSTGAFGLLTLALAVPAAVAAVVVLLSGSGSTATGSASSTVPKARAPHLVNVAVRVSDPKPGLHTLPPNVEVIVKNIGGSLAVLKGARVQIENAYGLTLCMSQGDLPLSAKYRVLLPTPSMPERQLEAPLHDTVTPDGADRFLLTFGVTDDEIRREMGKTESDIYIYRLRLSLEHDTGAAADELGDVLLALPQPPIEGQNLNAAGGAAANNEALRAYEASGMSAKAAREIQACWKRNDHIVARALRLKALKPASLARLQGQL
jgi:hypothetical protein